MALSPNFRWYMVDGQKYPSVTSLLHDFVDEPDSLKKWKDNVPNWKEIMKNAANVGTLVHHNIAQYYIDKFDLKQELKPLGIKELIDSQVEIRAGAAMSYFDDFLRQFEFEPVAVEVETHHKVMKYAGTIDAPGWWGKDREPAIVDWKTGSNIYPTYPAQVVAYEKMFLSQKELCEKFGIKEIKRRMIVLINPLKGLTVGEVMDPSIAWDMFFGAFDKFQELFRPEKRLEKSEVS